MHVCKSWRWKETTRFICIILAVSSKIASWLQVYNASMACLNVRPAMQRCRDDCPVLIKLWTVELKILDLLLGATGYTKKTKQNLVYTVPYIKVVFNHQRKTHCYRQHCTQRNAPAFKLLRGGFWVFRPAGATRCTDESEIWHGWGDRRSTPCQISPPSVQRLGYTTPKTEIFTDIWSKYE